MNSYQGIKLAITFCIFLLIITIIDTKNEQKHLRNLLTTFSMSFITPISYSSTQFCCGQVTLLQDGKTMVGFQAQTTLLGLFGTLYQSASADSSTSSFSQTDTLTSIGMANHGGLSSINTVEVGNNIFMSFLNASSSNDKNTMIAFKYNNGLSVMTQKTNYFSSLASGYSSLVVSSVKISSTSIAVMHFTLKE
jgi:hypothetical protein